MTTSVVDDFAKLICYVDGDNTLTPHQLGHEIAFHLNMMPRHLRRDSNAVIAFVKRTNPDKRMGAGRLAELLVAEFDLDKEN